MYEDQIQTYDSEICEEYLIYDTPFPCHIIYSHVQTLAQLQTRLITLKGKNIVFNILL